MALDYNVLVSGVLGFATATGTWWVASRQQKAQERAQSSKFSLSEREMLDKEARELRHEIRQELGKCKEDNDRLETYIKSLEEEIELLKKKIRSFDYELWEWRSGQRKMGDPPPKYE